jgi:hypothetical protein
MCCNVVGGVVGFGWMIFVFVVFRFCVLRLFILLVFGVCGYVVVLGWGKGGVWWVLRGFGGVLFICCWGFV